MNELLKNFYSAPIMISVVLRRGSKSESLFLKGLFEGTPVIASTIDFDTPYEITEFRSSSHGTEFTLRRIDE